MADGLDNLAGFSFREERSASGVVTDSKLVTGDQETVQEHGEAIALLRCSLADSPQVPLIRGFPS